MHKGLQYAAKAAVLACFVVLLLTQTSFYRLSAKSVSTDPTPENTVTELQPVPKRLVVASLKDDDTTWLQRRLPDWDVARYIVDDPQAKLTVPVNKGREAMVYLTYIIENYDRLADINVFIHALQYQWHNDDPNKDGATVISRLQLPFIHQHGYVNMRCAWTLGCPGEVRVTSPTTKREDPNNPDTASHFAQAFRELFPLRAAQNDIPTVVGASCCAQFAVSKAKLRETSRSEYERIRDWLRDTPLPDNISGRIMEYSWHIFFGKGDVHCPDAPACYCNVFGLCDLQNCSQSACPGQYTLPKYSTMPPGWKQLAEYDRR
jgi:hypothetical protein